MTNETGGDLVVHGLVKEYRGAEGSLRILDGVDLALARGDALVVTGPSGSGKSTLLYVLGILDKPTSGSVRLLGTDPFVLGTADQARFRNENIGFVFQDHHLLPQCTVLENVLIPTLAGGGADDAARERARRLIERVGLGHRIGHRPGQLSGGERQRTSVCRALINEPALVLADEPTGNLDRATAETVGSLLLELCREQNTLLVCVTHSGELAARFPRQMELVNGKLAQSEEKAIAN